MSMEWSSYTCSFPFLLMIMRILQVGRIHRCTQFDRFLSFVSSAWKATAEIFPHHKEGEISLGLQTLHDEVELVAQGLISVRHADLGHVGLTDVVAFWTFLQVVFPQEVDFFLEHTIKPIAWPKKPLSPSILDLLELPYVFIKRALLIHRLSTSVNIINSIANGVTSWDIPLWRTLFLAISHMSQVLSLKTCAAMAYSSIRGSCQQARPRLRDNFHTTLLFVCGGKDHTLV